MEKRAMIVNKATELKQAIRAVSDENAANIKVAIHNRNVFFTGEGSGRDYSTAALRELIKHADTLISLALDD